MLKRSSGSGAYEASSVILLTADRTEFIEKFDSDRGALFIEYQLAFTT